MENELKPCGYFKKYKAIYRPKCKCIPCREKYIDKLESLKIGTPSDDARKRALNALGKLMDIFDDHCNEYDIETLNEEHGYDPRSEHSECIRTNRAALGGE